MGLLSAGGLPRRPQVAAVTLLDPSAGHQDSPGGAHGFQPLRQVPTFPTLLRIIAGSETPTSRQVLVGDRPIKALGSDRGMVPQDHALRGA